MKYSLKENFLIKESKEEQVELRGTELTVYHLTSKNKLSVMSREHVSAEEPEITGDKAKDILNKIEYKKYSKIQGKKIPDDVIEYRGITSILGDPFTSGTGFVPGGGDMYGPALYTCYKFNPSIVERYGDICLKFKFDISNCIIFFEDLARQVHGKNWRVFDQIKNILSNKTSEEYSPQTKAKINKIIQAAKSSTGANNIRGLNNKSYLNDNDVTSGAALKISKILRSLGMTNVIDGLIFRGGRDGPVCVIYNAARDANLVKLGRVSNGEVKWSNSLAEFFNNSKYLDISFEDMQEIARENNVDEVDSKIDIDSLTNKIEVLEMLLDKSLDPNILEKVYSEFDDQTIKRRVLSHINAPPELLYNVASTSQDTDTLTFACSNKNFPYERLKQDVVGGKDVDKTLLTLLLSMTKYMDEPLAKAIYKNENHVIRAYAINWKKLPTDMVDEMINDPNEYIRGRAAVHRNVSREVFESANVNDSSEIIRRRIAESTSDIEKLKILATDKDDNVRFYAARNDYVDDNLKEEVYKIIVNDNNVNIRSIIAMRSKNTQTLDILANDERGDVRTLVAKNINCSVETLEKLSSDSSQGISSAAKFTLRVKIAEDDMAARNKKNENLLRKYIKSILV